MSQKVITKGNLEYRERGNVNGTGTQMEPVLVRCPVCGVEFTHGNNRVHHLRNAHSLEDWGLTPMENNE